jgi:hypothetical protein
MSVLPSVCLSTWKNLASTKWILMKFDIWRILRNPVKKIQVTLKFDKNNRVLYTKTKYICYNISPNTCWNEMCPRRAGENKNKHFVFSNLFSGICVFYEKMWKNMEEPDRPVVTILRMRYPCLITNVRHILIICNT